MYFIRHGQSEFNIHFDRTGKDPQIPDSPLSSFGVHQVEAAAKKLAQTKIEVIISSPYTRALQTAAAIAGVLKAPIHVEPLVGERRLYSCDIGTPVPTLKQRWSQVDFAAMPEEGEWWMPFHESASALEKRATAFSVKAAALRKDTTLVVSHWYFLHAMTGRGLDNAEIVEGHF